MITLKTVSAVDTVEYRLDLDTTSWLVRAVLMGSLWDCCFSSRCCLSQLLVLCAFVS
jgi:hypothetical protein